MAQVVSIKLPFVRPRCSSAFRSELRIKESDFIRLSGINQLSQPYPTILPGSVIRLRLLSYCLQKIQACGARFFKRRCTSHSCHLYSSSFLPTNSTAIPSGLSDATPHRSMGSVKLLKSYNLQDSHTAATHTGTGLSRKLG